LKVSITDIRAAKNDINAYGTFTVQVRLASDSDNAPQILEQFTGCNLNPASENYVAKKIGDKYVEYDTTQRRLREYGEFNNQSKYIYIIMESLVSDGSADPALLPFGFYGPPKPLDFTVVSGSVHTFDSGSSGADPAGAVGTYITTFATGSKDLTVDAARSEDATSRMRPDGLGDQGGSPDSFLATPIGTTTLTASFLFPSIPLRSKALDGGLSDPTKAYFGIQPTITATSTRFDPGYADYVRPAPGASDTFTAGGSFENSFIFTLDDVKTGGIYESGSAAAETSLNGAGSSYTASLDAGYNRFKRAIDTVSDPEFVEGNVLSVPGVTQPGITDQVIAVAESRADSLAVIDIENVYTPNTETTDNFQGRLGTVTSAVNTLKQRRINSSYGCTFYPWVRIRDDISNASLWVPPSVIAIGTFASSEARG
jgi:hypothetical protein